MSILRDTFELIKPAKPLLPAQRLWDGVQVAYSKQFVVRLQASLRGDAVPRAYAVGLTV